MEFSSLFPTRHSTEQVHQEYNLFSIVLSLKLVYPISPPPPTIGVARTCRICTECRVATQNCCLFLRMDKGKNRRAVCVCVNILAFSADPFSCALRQKSDLKSSCHVKPESECTDSGMEFVRCVALNLNHKVPIRVWILWGVALSLNQNVPIQVWNLWGMYNVTITLNHNVPIQVWNV